MQSARGIADIFLERNQLVRPPWSEDGPTLPPVELRHPPSSLGIGSDATAGGPTFDRVS